MGEFESRGCAVLGASIDSQYCHKAWDESGALCEMKYPLMSDMQKKISAKYQVLNSDGFAIRGTFLINPEGTIVFQMVNTPEIGRNVGEILRVLDACQSGGACPANWKKGDKNL